MMKRSSKTNPVVFAVTAQNLQDFGLLLCLRHPQHALVDASVLARVFVADLQPRPVQCSKLVKSQFGKKNLQIGKKSTIR